MDNTTYFPQKKVISKQVHQIWSWQEVFIQHGPVGPMFYFEIFKRDLRKKVT